MLQTGKYREILAELDDRVALHRQHRNSLALGRELHNAGIAAYRLGQWDVADKLFEEAIQVLDNVAPSLAVIESMYGMALSRSRRGDESGSMEAFDSALALVEKASVTLLQPRYLVAFRGQLQRIYNDYLRFLDDIGGGNEAINRKAFLVFEKKQARGFVAYLASRGIDRSSISQKVLVAKERRLHARIGSLERELLAEQGSAELRDHGGNVDRIRHELAAAQTAIGQFNKDMMRRFPRYYELQRPKSVDVAQLQASILNPGEVLVSYALLEDRLLIWGVARNKFIYRSVAVTANDVVEVLASIRRSWLLDNHWSSEPSRGGVKIAKYKVGRQDSTPSRSHYLELLSTWLIPQAVSELVDSEETLLVVPSGPLYSFPFEVLTMDGGVKKEHVVERIAVSYIPSASVLKGIRKKYEERKGGQRYPFIAFADPEYVYVSGSQNSRLEALPDTAAEAKEIAEILSAPDGSNALQLGQQASRSNVLALNESGRLRDYRYLLFAVHGSISDDGGKLRPELIMSQPDLMAEGCIPPPSPRGRSGGYIPTKPSLLIIY